MVEQLRLERGFLSRLQARRERLGPHDLPLVGGPREVGRTRCGGTKVPPLLGLAVPQVLRLGAVRQPLDAGTQPCLDEVDRLTHRAGLGVCPYCAPVDVERGLGDRRTFLRRVLFGYEIEPRVQDGSRRESQERTHLVESVVDE